MTRRRGGRVPGVLLVAILLGALVSRWHAERQDRGLPAARVNPIDAALSVHAAGPAADGTAAAILLDASGSMAEEARDAAGATRTRMEVARGAVARVVRRCESFAREHPGQLLRVGIYAFSHLARRPPLREVVPLGPPDLARTERALANVVPKGGTPLGDAMLEAKRALDRTGLRRRHLVVVTDGASNHGYNPADVTSAPGRQSGAARAGVYFVAFEIDAERFAAVRDAGALVLGAASAADLDQAIEYLLSGKILAEQPELPR